MGINEKLDGKIKNKLRWDTRSEELLEINRSDENNEVNKATATVSYVAFREELINDD